MGMLDGMFGRLLKRMRENLSRQMGPSYHGEEQIYREEITIGPDGTPQKKSVHIRHEMSEADVKRFMEENRAMLDDSFKSPEEMKAHMERILREMGAGPPTMEGLREAMRRAGRR